MRTEHEYRLELEWTGARGTGTTGHRSYGRDHVVGASGLPPLAASADPTFFGDADRYNPEQLLVAALASCHLLSYLHVAARAGVVVTAYRDAPSGVLALGPDGSGRVTGVTLRPEVTVADESMAGMAARLHGDANRACFIAASVAFEVAHEPVTLVAR